MKNVTMDFELIIFDFDGTLGDTRQKIVRTLQQTMREIGLPVADEKSCAATIGVPLAEAYRQLFPDITSRAADFYLEFEDAEHYRRTFEANKQHLIPDLFPHVADTLAQLHAKGLKMTIASSRTSKSLRWFLQEMGLERYFDFVIGAEDVQKAKPDPEPVLTTLAKMGIEAERALVVGDMAVDILMGSRAGARTCGVTYGNGSREDLLAAGADFLVDDIGELEGIMN